MTETPIDNKQKKEGDQMQHHALNPHPIAPLPEFFRTIHFAHFNQIGDSSAARACFASILKSLSWPCAASLDQPRAESFRRQQTTWARSGPDRRAASTCPLPSKSACHFP